MKPLVLAAAMLALATPAAASCRNSYQPTPVCSLVLPSRADAAARAAPQRSTPQQYLDWARRR